MYCKNISTLVGNVEIMATEQHIISISITESRRPDSLYFPLCLLDCEQQLSEYFDGSRKTFQLPLAMEGSIFQKTVWQALANIPYGTTITYKELAQKIGNVNAARAVGNANGQNPLCIVIPCHRVVKGNGKLGGYSAGNGTDTKRRLIEMEREYGQ